MPTMSKEERKALMMRRLEELRVELDMPAIEFSAAIHAAGCRLTLVAGLPPEILMVATLSAIEVLGGKAERPATDAVEDAIADYQSRVS